MGLPLCGLVRFRMATDGHNLAVLAEACRALLSAAYNDFWVLASLTDCSYEEGERSDDFVRSIARYERAGVRGPLLENLRKGINDNLADALAKVDPDIAIAADRNKSKSQDLVWSSAGHRQGRAEVKLVYDCTLSSYYPKVAADYTVKLHKVRSSGLNADLFLLVFFVQLPSHDYPSGQWEDSPKASQDRRRYLRKRGIGAQYEELRRYLGDGPAWPTDGLYRQPLTGHLTSVDVSVLARRYELFFKSESPWQFDLDRSLEGAEVGVGIWQCP